MCDRGVSAAVWKILLFILKSKCFGPDREFSKLLNICQAVQSWNTFL